MTENDFYSTRVKDALRIVFPEGTRIRGADDPDWTDYPPFAADIFAFCAYVIQLNGLMGYYDANPDAAGRYTTDHALRVVLKTADRKECAKASKDWRASPEDAPLPPKLVADLWRTIIQSSEECIRVKKAQKDHRNRAKGKKHACPAWWTAIFKLLVIADEACEGIGHVYEPSNPRKNNVPDLRIFDARVREIRKREEAVPKLGMIRAEKDVVTLCAFADRHIVCVQPKGRVSQIGCSVRNLSRNLALTGPVGVVRCNWQQLVQNARESDLRRSLNVLLVPLPWEIHASNFEARSHGDWGEFAIKQEWLPSRLTGKMWEKFYLDIETIIKTAMIDTPEIDAIVFPEMALTYPIFKKLFEKISSPKDGLLPKLQFMIAGTTNNCDNEKGNHVLTGIRENNLVVADGTNPTKSLIRVFSQRKHHRWKLNKDQISTYGLASVLGPSIPWWEDHFIEARELNFFQFRRDAVLASLICEDLARNDPCHDIMRSVAPNLIFALLMDGPQLANRWPARYAGSLADDPGSTVITLTSFGLVARSNNQFADRKSNSVGLIRDGRGTTREITLPVNHRAILLTLGSDAVTDFTIDGRKTDNASEWYYISQKPIR